MGYLTLDYGDEDVDSDAEILARRAPPEPKEKRYRVKLKKTGLPHPHPEYESVCVPVDPVDGPPTFHMKATAAEVAKAGRALKESFDKFDRNRMHRIPNLDLGAPGNTMFNLKEYL
jgi:hypothetical protein